MAKDTALATQHAVNALTPAPDYFAKNDRRGLENTTQSDVSIPRLALAQPGKPQVTDGHPEQIPGLAGGDLYNSLTKQVYGKDVRVQILRKMPIRAMEFIPVKDGGGVADPNVPTDLNYKGSGHGGKYADDRLNFHGDEKPVATLFRDFIAVILPQREIVALSFKSSNLPVATALWGLVCMRDRPVFAGKYRITSKLEIKPEMHMVFEVQNDGWVSEQDALAGEQMYEAVQNINVEHVDHTPEREPGDEFDTAAMDAGKTSEM
jgi:hypothetical protein